MHGYIGRIPQGLQEGEVIVIIVDSREPETAKFFRTVHGSTSSLRRVRPDSWSLDKDTWRETANFNGSGFNRFTSFSYSHGGLRAAPVVMTVDRHAIPVEVQRLDNVGTASMLYLLTVAARPCDSNV